MIVGYFGVGVLLNVHAVFIHLFGIRVLLNRHVVLMRPWKVVGTSGAANLQNNCLSFQ